MTCTLDALALCPSCGNVAHELGFCPNLPFDQYSEQEDWMFVEEDDEHSR